MKIVRVIGGLGNQMFQYCFFLYLRKKQIETKLDITDFNDYSLHQGYELNRVFGINDENDIASSADIEGQKDQMILLKLRKLLGRTLFGNVNILIKKTHWVEPNYSAFYETVYKTDHSYFDGYWQNENYLSENEHEIKQIFQWKFIKPENLNLSRKMENEESVALHIRRLDSPHSLRQLLYTIRLHIVFRSASKEYYINAINYILAKIKKPVFYIFTNDILWVRKNFPLDNNYIFIDWNRGSESNQDMYLMTRCKHNIISMSSFSWWGAWLNENTDKIVIAPKNG